MDRVQTMHIVDFLFVWTKGQHRSGVIINYSG